MGDYPLYDGPEYDANEPDWDALPVIVCAGCGETVHADGLNERCCLACEAHLIWIAAGRPMSEPEALRVSFDNVPF